MKKSVRLAKWVGIIGVAINTLSIAHAQKKLDISYSATQLIETVPGPFSNKIFISPQKERQDASLGGAIVSTIIRHDKGVAWLLIPSSKQYQEIDIKSVESASVHALLDQQNKLELGREQWHNFLVTKFAIYKANESVPTWLWVSEQGILLKAEIPQNDDIGRPKATILLTDIEIGKQEDHLFELPMGYTKFEK